MAETAEVFALRQKVRDLRGQLHSRDKALRLKREEFIPKEVANMEEHYARLWKSLCEAREELKKKNEQLMAQESELSALRAKVAELMTQQAARDGVNLASVDNSLYPSSTMEVESEPDLNAVFREVYTAYKNLQLQYDDVREEGKITTIYDNEKGVCIHVPDDTGPCTGRSTGPERAQNEPNNEPNNQPHTGPPRLSWAGFKQAT